MPAGNAPYLKLTSYPVTVTIWKNTTVRDGEEVEFFTVSVAKSYKKNGQWRESNSFSVQDLPKAVLLIQEAYRRLGVKQFGEGADNGDENVPF